jgi:hypothetical protein
MTAPDMPRLAFYYPGPSWRIRESEWIKSLLLFFDGIALLVPKETTTYNLPDSPFE